MMPGKNHHPNVLGQIFENLKRMVSGQNNDPNELQEILDELKRPAELREIPHRIKLCQRALAMISKESEPKQWGFLQNNLGLSLARTQTGSRAENLEQAIDHFALALEVRTRAEHAKEWASIQNNLGSAYRDRIQGDHEENLEKAVECYQAALKVRTREQYSKEWALTLSNLAGVYYIRIHGDRAENLEQAIQCYEQVLEVRTPEANKEEWAATQNNLANAYRDRIRGERAENIEQAIHHYQQSLSVYTSQTFPQDWASIQDNLGNAFSYRIHGDRAKNIEQAIEHFQQALEERTRSASLEDCAQTHSHLGNAYLMRLRGKHTENIEQAIQHYEQALAVMTRTASPTAWARTRNSLGNAYLARVRNKRPENAEERKNVERAIFNYKQALEERTPETNKEEWAETLNNLAGAERLGAPEEVEQSIQDLQQTLGVYTHEAFPQYWARAHNNLGMAYADRTQGERAENVEQAVYHYQQALKVYTREPFSVHCLNTARGLSNLAFEEERWELARQNYDIVFAVQDALMHASLSSESEKTELAEVQNLPPRAAYAYWKLGDVKRAVEVLEKGRAQLLRESFEHQWKDLERLPALGFEKLHDEYLQARNTYRALQSIETSNDLPSTDWRRAWEKVQAAVSAIRDEVGQRHLEYRYFLQSLPFDEIVEQAREASLVYLCSTSAGGLALVVNEQGTQGIEFPDLKQESLQKQIWRPTNEEIERINAHLHWGRITPEDIQAVRGGYFSMYALWSLTPYLSIELKKKLSEAWNETLSETTRWLWDRIMGRLLPVLKEHSQSAILIPAGQLALLPLHAACKNSPSDSPRRWYALDELNISYVPSAHALWRASLAAGERSAESLLAVNNPDGSLSNRDGSLSPIEAGVQAMFDLFEPSKHFHREAATIEAVKTAMPEADVLYFFTHANAGWQAAEQARLKLANGYLTLPDIFKLDLRKARLAVLSACETGVPGLELIDEMIGLPAGMMQAGVPGVVGSLWSVMAISTVLLMARFYHLWREKGFFPKEALRQAQIWLRDSTSQQKKEFVKSVVLGKNSRLSSATAVSFYKYLSSAESDELDFSSPYYWAAFTFTGV